MRTIIHTLSVLSVVVGAVAAAAAPAAAQGPGTIELPAFALQQPPRPPQPPRGQRGPRGGQQRGPETTENFSQSVRVGGNGTFDLQNLAGNVVVTGGGGNDVAIQAVKRVFGGSEEQRKTRLQQVQIEVRQQASRVEVRPRYPENNGRDRDGVVVVDFTIALPQNTSVFVRSISGDVRATNVRGELRLETLSGNIAASGARRIGLLKTVSGNITVTDVEADGDVTFQTLSGDLVAQNIRARSVDASAISGDIRLTDVQSERVNVKSLNGDINYSGTVQRTGRYELTTQSGDIVLALSAAGFDVDATTFSGDITSDFAVTLGGTGRNGRRGPGQAVRATFGDGGAVLSLRSFNGDITINKR